jgi:hypothetical protein
MEKARSAEQLSRALADRLEKLLQVARSSPVGGGPDWDALLDSLAVERLSPAERAQYLAESPPMHKGALPLEVRRGLEALEREGRLASRQVSRDDPGLDALERELRDLVKRELRAYLAFVRPPAGVGRIFQNALATTARYAATTAHAGALRCEMCGAAREREAVTVCQYCGTSFFPSGVP